MQGHERRYRRERLGNGWHDDPAGRALAQFLWRPITDDDSIDPDLLRLIGKRDRPLLSQAGWRDKNHQISLLDRRKWPVQHLLGRCAFGVEVGGLLDLQRRFHRGRAGRPGPRQPDLPVTDVRFGERADQRLRFQRAAHRRRQLGCQQPGVDRRRASALLADGCRDAGEDSEGGRVRDRVSRRTIRRDGREQMLHLGVSRSALLAGDQRQRRLRRSDAIECLEAVVPPAGVAEDNDGVALVELRSIEGEVERIAGDCGQASAEGAHEELAHQRGVVGRADANDPESVLARDVGGEALGQRLVRDDGGGDCLRLVEHMPVHIERVGRWSVSGAH